MKAVKHDKDKAPLSIIPRVALEAEARVFKYGAKKYGMHNFRQGMKWLRLTDAALRHIYQFIDGQDVDTETLESHIAHARCNLAMLLYFIEEGKGEDNRYNDKKKAFKRSGISKKRIKKSKSRKQTSSKRTRSKQQRSKKN